MKKKMVAVLAALALLVGAAPAAQACDRRPVRITNVQAVCQYAPVAYVLVSADAVHPVGQDAVVTIETGGVAIATVTGHLDSPVHITAFVDPKTRVTVRIVTADGTTTSRRLVAPSCVKRMPRGHR